MKTFKNLTAQDVNLIMSTYKKTNKKEEAQNHLGQIMKVSSRTIRRWYRDLKTLKEKRTEVCDTKENILIIGDLHEPFSLEGYIKFCKHMYDKYKCKRTIFMGDIIDNHYSSYHETDPNGWGGGDELQLAINKISKWSSFFPKAQVIIGNHDRIIMRKAQTSAIPKEWIKDYKEVLHVGNWDFQDRIVVNDIQFVHGEAGTARNKCKSDMQSTIQGHLHTQAYTEYFVGSNYKIFGSQVGCGIDFESYSMAYAKRGKKPAIGCMVLLNSETPINLLMDL